MDEGWWCSELTTVKEELDDMLVVKEEEFLDLEDAHAEQVAHATGVE